MSIQVNDKNLGHATAYAYAVAGGYTGTEAEFTELLGNIADDLGQIENLTVTVETLAAGSSATASYSNGVLHLGIPKGDKGDGAYHVEPSGESFAIHTDADGIVTSAQEIRISINAKQGTSAMVISSVTGLPNISLAGGGNIAPEIFKNAFTGSVATIIYTIPANSQITAEQINAQYIARINNGTPNGYGISCSLSVAVVKDGAKGDTGATGPTGPTGNGIASVAKTGTSGLVDTYTITYTNGNTSTFTVTNGAEAVDNTLTIAGRAADAKKTGDEISELKEDLTTKADLDELYKAFPTDTATGSVASFADGANVPVKSLIVNIDPVQSGSGDPSPTNIRPISGWSEVNVQRTGKNLLALPVVRFSEVDATIANCFFIKAGTYCVSFDVSCTHRIGIRLLDLNGNVYSDEEHKPVSGLEYNSNTKSYYQGADSSKTHREVAVTIVQDCYVRIVSNLTGGGLTNAQLELGSTTTPYEPYSGQSINIQLGQTVYGGTLDVLSGELVIDRAMVDLAEASASHAGSGRWSYSFADIRKTTSTTEVSQAIAESFHAVSSNAYNNVVGTFFQTVNSTVVGVCNGDVTNKPSGKLVYPLATPITVTLTPNELSTLLGANNIWADTGDSTVEYRADPTLYVQRKIAEAISALS